MVRVLLKFSKEIVDQPITSQIIMEHEIPINILSAHINQQGGEILAEIPTDQANKAIEAFRKKGVTVDVRTLIDVNEKCFECGACVALCPVNAIAFEKDYSVVFYEDRCLGIACGLCTDACPARAIRLIG